MPLPLPDADERLPLLLHSGRTLPTAASPPIQPPHPAQNGTTGPHSRGCRQNHDQPPHGLTKLHDRSQAHESTTKPRSDTLAHADSEATVARARKYDATDNHVQADNKPCPTSQARIYDKTAPGRTHSAQRRSANRSTSPLPARKTHLLGIGAHKDQAPGFPTKKTGCAHDKHIPFSVPGHPDPGTRTPRLPAFALPARKIRRPRTASRKRPQRPSGPPRSRRLPSAIGSDQK